MSVCPFGETELESWWMPDSTKVVLRELVDAFATADDRRRPPLAGMKTRELHGFVQRVLRVASEIKSLNEKLAEATRLPTSNLLGAGLPAELAFYAAWALASSKEPWSIARVSANALSFC